MRVAVLEWICGGGMHQVATDEIPTSLAKEGQAMLGCLLRLLSEVRAEVRSMIDPRLVDRHQFAPSRCQLVDFQLPSIELSPMPAQARLDAVEQTIHRWIEFASKSDLVLVVAPEIEGVLQRCLRAMQAADLPLLNCTGAMLDNACSKLHTASRLHQASIAHPETLSLNEFKRSSGSGGGDQLWCIKSDLGAGCEGLQVGRYEEIRMIAEAMLESEPTVGTAYVVQPWIDGQAFSCSAIVDRTGTACWFPLVTQSFLIALAESGCSTRIYQGGKIVVNSTAITRPTQLLNRTIEALAESQPRGALGWIGVDLLLDRSGRWIVIEVNPRMTTSIIGLSAASPTNLGQFMLQAFQGKAPALDNLSWNGSISFNATGAVATI